MTAYDKDGKKNNRKLIITIHPDGDTTIAAYCLKTDIWHDYLTFKEDAKQAISRNDLRNANRYLRVSVLCLFSHLEAVVNDIVNRKSIPEIYGSRLCDRTKSIRSEAEKFGRVPYLNFRLEKMLRDLVAHPGVTKDFVQNDETETLDSASVFEKLDLQTLEALERKISPWIDTVCRLLNVERFSDTAKIVGEFSGKLLPERPTTEV